ncbi:hypothetical protein GCWU000324_00269 [Kingella oralis ATCC 51147]|uniref:Uncharacterized protein n=1 Tax=Kingella oralis ATCC 51147 TaxID=629741 RepID=C4GHD7_9NEIS|nr:hypothetical protein GCWU000324_00269 [Kingella oralis ATCC 51147]
MNQHPPFKPVLFTFFRLPHPHKGSLKSSLNSFLTNLNKNKHLMIESPALLPARSSKG